MYLELLLLFKTFNLFVNRKDVIKGLPPKCDLLVLVCVVAIPTPKAFPHRLILSQNINFKEFDLDACSLGNKKPS